jgi:glycosyltransferase involved in cell wall biosynthesis
MNILQVAPLYTASPQHFGSGVVRVVYHVSKELVRRGHAVTICTSSSAEGTGSHKQIQDTSNPAILDGIRVFFFPYSISHNLFYFTPQVLPYLKKNLHTFDVAHLHDVRSFQSIVTHHYAKERGFPYVLQLHGSYLGTIKGSKLKWLLDNAISYKVLRDSKRVIALTKTEAEYYRKKGIAAGAIDIVGNGIEIPQYGEQTAGGRFREKVAIRDDQFIILYVGRIASSKGLDMLVEAFSVLKNSVGAAKLVLVGEDYLGYESALKKQVRGLNIEDSTIFTGPISESDKIDAYRDADVFVTPNFTGLPLTFLESCACGTPIVTTHNGDDIDWIDGHVGYVVNYDKNDLANAISNILLDDRTRAEFKANCRKLVEKKFGWSNVVDKIEETYRRAANS